MRWGTAGGVGDGGSACAHTVEDMQASNRHNGRRIGNLDATAQRFRAGGRRPGLGDAGGMRYAATGNAVLGNTSKVEPSILRSLELLRQIVWRLARVVMIICNILNQQKNCPNRLHI